MKYVSIDLETCGLDPLVHPILEFGAVATEIDYRPSIYTPVRYTFRALVIPPNLDAISVSPFTAKLHTRLWDEIEMWKKDGSNYTCGLESGVVHPRVVCQMKSEQRGCSLPFLFAQWLCRCWPKLAEAKSAKEWGTEVRPKITVAGKNAATFDLPFLRAQSDIDAFVDIRHRVLDVASHFWRPGDECLPSLDVCLERAGIPKRTCHGALDDALLVCDLIDKVFSK